MSSLEGSLRSWRLVSSLSNFESPETFTTHADSPGMPLLVVVIDLISTNENGMSGRNTQSTQIISAVCGSASHSRNERDEEGRGVVRCHSIVRRSEAVWEFLNKIQNPHGQTTSKQSGSTYLVLTYDYHSSKVR